MADSEKSTKAAAESNRKRHSEKSKIQNDVFSKNYIVSPRHRPKLDIYIILHPTLRGPCTQIRNLESSDVFIIGISGFV